MTTTNKHDDHEPLKSPARIDALPEEVISYYEAAITDEINGFGFTAAMEWQKAAELFARFPLIADLCWRQWERITLLPRHLATPLLAHS